jgi:hypothetical protein
VGPLAHLVHGPGEHGLEESRHLGRQLWYVRAALGRHALEWTVDRQHRKATRWRGASREDALVHTSVTAGRTVLFSATTVALSMAAMILFPMDFLKSFSYAGIAMVAFAGIAAVLSGTNPV